LPGGPLPVAGAWQDIVCLCMGMTVMLGALFGGCVAISGDGRFNRLMFITVMLVLTVRLAWRFGFGFGFGVIVLIFVCTFVDYIDI